MGWSGGSEVGNGVWNAVSKYIPDTDKQAVAQKIVDILEDNDADTISSECPALYSAAYPWQLVQVTVYESGDKEYDVWESYSTEEKAKDLLEKMKKKYPDETWKVRKTPKR